jgi:hypothetical protein
MLSPSTSQVIKVNAVLGYTRRQSACSLRKLWLEFQKTVKLSIEDNHDSFIAIFRLSLSDLLSRFPGGQPLWGATTLA